MRSTGYIFLVPAREPAPTMPPSRSGYTRRRSGDAGPARRVRGGRKTLFFGCATGSPSGDTGEMAGFWTKPCRFISGHERRACLCGTQGTGGLFGFSSPLSARIFSGKGDGRRTPSPVLQREPLAWQKPLNGALRGVIYTKIYAAAFSARSDVCQSRGRIRRPEACPWGRCPVLALALPETRPCPPPKPVRPSPGNLTLP
jgi:hypothetical protein